jgi:hypothetical protein
MKPLWAYVERIEEGKAILDIDAGADAPSLARLEIDVAHLPAGTREGAVLKITFADDADERRRREKEVVDLQRRLRDRTRRLREGT